MPKRYIEIAFCQLCVKWACSRFSSGNQQSENQSNFRTRSVTDCRNLYTFKFKKIHFFNNCAGFSAPFLDLLLELYVFSKNAIFFGLLEFAFFINFFSWVSHFGCCWKSLWSDFLSKTLNAKFKFGIRFRHCWTILILYSALPTSAARATCTQR